MKQSTFTVTIRIRVLVSWGVALKMFLIGRYPSAIIAKAIADRIRSGK